MRNRKRQSNLQLIVIVAISLFTGEALAQDGKYSRGLNDAIFIVDNHKYILRSSTNTNELLIQAAPDFKYNTTQLGLVEFRQAAEYFVTPVGCGIETIKSLDGVSGQSFFWFARYQCPPDIDLNKLIKQQVKELRKGQPLHK